jgi:GMP synthase-like glutamine amidotransferase
MIVMLQFRDDISEPHEQKCVLRHAPEGQEIKFVSVFDPSAPYEDPERLLEGADALIVGASGGISMGAGHRENDYEKLAYVMNRTRPVLDYIFERDFPTLGFCFGHQMMADHQGAKVEFNRDMQEAGFTEISLTQPGLSDPLFAGVPPKFWASEGHQDSVEEVPPSATLLASSERCFSQAFRYSDNILSTQFHGELDAHDLIERLNLFPHYLKANDVNMTPIPTPYSVLVLRNFLKSTAGVH